MSITFTIPAIEPVVSGPITDNQFTVEPARSPVPISMRRLRRALGVVFEEVGAIHDADLTDACQVALQDIAEICGQPVLREEIVYQFNGRIGMMCTPGYHPISDWTKLEAWTANDGWAEISSGYRIWNDEGVYSLYYSRGYAVAPQYRATIMVGYETLPMTVGQIAIEMVTFIIKNSFVPGLGEGRLGIAKKAKNFGAVAASDEYKELRSDWERRLSTGGYVIHG